jgi:hypothetical protein
MSLHAWQYSSDAWQEEDTMIRPDEYIELADLIRKNRASFTQLGIELIADYLLKHGRNFNRQRWLDYVEKGTE